MMHKVLLFMSLIVAVLCLRVSAQAAPDECTPAAGNPIRLGAVFPPDTLLSVEAGDPYRGVVALVTAINGCGSLQGRPIEIVYVPAANRQEAQLAVDTLTGDVPLVIGSGSGAVSEVLLEAAAAGAFVYWEVSEPLEASHEWAFSPRPNGYQLGVQAAAFVESEAVPLLNGNSPLAALIHENRRLAQAVANGVLDTLNTPLIITQSYENHLSSSYRVAVAIRESAVNVVIVAAFENDADRLWYDLREADANIAAWVQVGGDSYRRHMCDRLGNTDSLISITATGPVSDDYRRSLGPIYAQYTAAYATAFSRNPSERADLAASGVYLLLNSVLPAIADEEFTAATIREAILASNVAVAHGLMGEGLRFTPTTGNNQASVALVQQRQDNQFCTLYPAAIATCTQPMRPFPTWRERAKATEQNGC
jgi:ABC-type branched-subunit amino acid transport system substrate-binding protein